MRTRTWLANVQPAGSSETGGDSSRPASVSVRITVPVPPLGRRLMVSFVSPFESVALPGASMADGELPSELTNLTLMSCGNAVSGVATISTLTALVS